VTEEQLDQELDEYMEESDLLEDEDERLDPYFVSNTNGIGNLYKRLFRAGKRHIFV